VLRLQKALLNFALKCYPGNLGFVNHCINQTVSVLRGASKQSKQAAADGQPAASSVPVTLDDAAVMELESLLSIPLASLALQVLELNEYSDILAFLPWESRKQVALELVRAVLAARTSLSDLGKVTKLFEMMAPLLKDDPGAVAHSKAAEDGTDDAASATNEAEQFLRSGLL
jgi:vacuolar protein sorting-associated protein 35